MARSKSKQPTEGELEILRVLWREGPSELASVRRWIQESRDVATTTIATMLKIMMEKGMVKRTRKEGKWIWSAKQSQRVTARGMVKRLVESAFDGSTQDLVSHLIREGELSDQDREEIRRLLGDGGSAS